MALFLLYLLLRSCNGCDSHRVINGVGVIDSVKTEDGKVVEDNGVVKPITGNDVADDLTTTEFAVAMLASRGWTNQEIAEQLNVSANTVKKHLLGAMRKLQVENRRDLKKYMLK